MPYRDLNKYILDDLRILHFSNNVTTNAIIKNTNIESGQIILTKTM